ncbi:hypothetical protein Efla_000154 [Eimeria flavescens]
MRLQEVFECPAGHYCPKGSIAPIECPSGTYNLSPLATASSYCLKCPAGYACMPGTIDYLQWPCPVGYFCPEGSAVALPCDPRQSPAHSCSTEQATRLKPPVLLPLGNCVSIFLSACLEQIAGYVCEGGENPPSPCPSGRLCVEEADGDSLCPAGFYCPGATQEPMTCPKNFYCPPGSGYPATCPEGSVCPAGIEKAILCPAGTYRATSEICMEEPSTSVCCQSCPAGTFAPSPGASSCAPCPAGYLCYGGTATDTPQLPDVDRGEPCPAGHYCPAGSSLPEPCPAGTYNNHEGGGNLLEACKPCEPNTYTDLPGQKGCYACGPTSTAKAGQTTCSCLGKHRWFQHTQGSCICEGGYESYGPTGISLSNTDSALNCQPIVRDNCSGSQLRQLVTAQSKLRDNAGFCVEPSTCKESCINTAGSFLVLAGQCICLHVRGADIVCDSECRQASTSYIGGALEFSSDLEGVLGRLQLTDFFANGRGLGHPSCPSRDSADCAIHFYITTKDGIFGLYGTPPDLHGTIQRSGNRSVASLVEETPQWDSTTLESAPAIKNPVHCLQLHDTVAWKMQEHIYPVYLKDSLLNSNNAIDLSPFSELESTLQSRREGSYDVKQASDLEYFLYTFAVEGVFVFGTSVDRSPLAIFSVLGEGVSCPSGTRFPELATPSSLARLRVHLQQELNVEPDLTLVLLTLGCILTVLVILLVSISAARKLQHKKRQAIGKHSAGGRGVLILGGRSSAIKARRRLEALLADLIEQRLIKVEGEKVLALGPSEVDGLLSTIPLGVPQPQAFEQAFGALHELSLKIKSFASQASRQFQHAARSVALETSQMQKEAISMLDSIKQRLQHRDRLREQSGNLLESLNSLLSDLRSPDVFITAMASGVQTGNAEEGQQAELVKLLSPFTNVGAVDGRYYRVLHASIYAMRFTMQDADRLRVLATARRLFYTFGSFAFSGRGSTDRVTNESSGEKEKLIQESLRMLDDAFTLLTSSKRFQEKMRDGLMEYKKREEDMLRATCSQYSATFDTLVASAVQGLVEQADALLQLHLDRLVSLTATATKNASAHSENADRISKAIQVHSNESKARFKQAVKKSIVELRQCLDDAVRKEQAAFETQEQQREALLTALLEQKVREQGDFTEKVHRVERQLVLAAFQLSIQAYTNREETAFQATLQAWTGAIHAATRAEALNLRRQVKEGNVVESEYRQRKASLASALDLDIQRLTRDHFADKSKRIVEFERQAMNAYENLMEATHARQELEKVLRREQADAFATLVRERQKHAWGGAALEKRLLYTSVLESWSQASATQERLFALEADFQEALALVRTKVGDNAGGTAKLMHMLKDARRQAESELEAMLEQTRVLQGQQLAKNSAQMESLCEEQEQSLKSSLREHKAALDKQRDEWLQALIHEADSHIKAQDKVQALGEHHALTSAISCLQAAAQSFYHEAATEEKERADLESLAFFEGDGRYELFHRRVADSLSLLKTTVDEECCRRADIMRISFQEHRKACDQASIVILEGHRELLEHHTINERWAHEAEVVTQQPADPPRADSQKGGRFAFHLFHNDWQEDFLSWQSGQLSERFEATTLDDSRLKQSRGADWVAWRSPGFSKHPDDPQEGYAAFDGPFEGIHPDVHRLEFQGELPARTRALIKAISSAQKSIVVGEAEWLEKCQGIQGGNQNSDAQDAKRKRAQNTRLERMKEEFMTKATELRKEHIEEVQALLEEEKQAETQLNRSQQAEEANIEMMFKIKEASLGSPDEQAELARQRQEAIAEMLEDFQQQRNKQKVDIQNRFTQAQASLQEKQKRLCRQFEESKREARQEFQDLDTSIQQKERSARKAKLVDAARVNPSAENIYALHKELKDQYQNSLNSLVIKQMQEKTKFRHRPAIDMGTLDGLLNTDKEPKDGADGHIEENKNLVEYTKHQSEALQQAKIRSLQEAAQDAAMQDEALGLQKEHLDDLIDTLREFSGIEDLPADGLLEQAVQEKARLAKEREDLRKFVSAQLLEADKLTRERKQLEDRRKHQDSQAALHHVKRSAKQVEDAAHRQTIEQEITRLRKKQMDEARKLRQFIAASGYEGKTLDELKANSERREKNLLRAIEAERQRQREFVVSRLNARVARQAKLAKNKSVDTFNKVETEVRDAQGLLQTIASKCALGGDGADAQSAEESDFRKFVWKMELKAFAEERIQNLSEALGQFLQKAQKAGDAEDSGYPVNVVTSEDLTKTVSQVNAPGGLDGCHQNSCMHL